MGSPNGLPNGIVFGQPIDPLAQIPTKARKDPLGPITVNSLFENSLWGQTHFLVEHRNDGYHNALEVPREVGLVTYAAGAYAVAGQSGRALITSVAKQAVGQCRVRFNGAAFKTGDLRDDASFVVAATGNGLESKPQMVLYQAVNATDVDVFIWQLSSALGGAGNNTWALVDDGFSIAAFAEATTAALTGFTNSTTFKPHQLGNQLGAELASSKKSWNSIPLLQAQIRKGFLVSHLSNGGHAAQEVARGQAHVKWNGVAYSFVENSGLFIACNTIGAGIAELTFDVRSSTNYEVFMEVDYSRNNGGAATDMYVIGCPKSSWLTTSVRPYIYKYDAVNNSWSHADTDFYLALHAP